MAKPEWGLKRKCLKCGTFFYDMNKKSFSCPKCKEAYTLDSYAESKTKQLLKLAKKAAPKIEDDTLDEEALLQMTEDIPLSDDDLGPDDLEILDDEDDLEDTDTPALTGLMDQYDDEEQSDK